MCDEFQEHQEHKPASENTRQQNQQPDPTNEAEGQNVGSKGLFSIPALVAAISLVLWGLADQFTGIWRFVIQWAYSCGFLFDVAFIGVNGCKSKLRNHQWWSKAIWGAYAAVCLGMLLHNVWILRPQGTGIQTASGWLPPELPPDCNNVFFTIGGHTFPVPRELLALTPVMHSEVDTTTGKPFMHFQGDRLTYDFTNSTTEFHKVDWVITTDFDDGTTNRRISFDFPAVPFIKSNRVYIAAESPLEASRQTVRMSDDWDDRIPYNWDRNYRSNFFEIVREDGLPVLQVLYKRPNEISVDGIFLIDGYNVFACFGNSATVFAGKAAVGFADGTVLTTTVADVYSHTNFGTAFLTNLIARIRVPNQKAQLAYPSWKYPGQWASQ